MFDGASMLLAHFLAVILILDQLLYKSFNFKI